MKFHELSADQKEKFIKDNNLSDEEIKILTENNISVLLENYEDYDPWAERE